MFNFCPLPTAPPLSCPYVGTSNSTRLYPKSKSLPLSPPHPVLFSSAPSDGSTTCQRLLGASEPSPGGRAGQERADLGGFGAWGLPHWPLRGLSQGQPSPARLSPRNSVAPVVVILGGPSPVFPEQMLNQRKGPASTGTAGSTAVSFLGFLI